MPGTPVGRPGEPGYAGLVTFCKVPLVLDPGDLRGADVAIVGAPIDETVTYRPGARFGPRAIRHADVGGGARRPNMAVGVDPFEVLTVVDYGDAPVKPGGGLHEARDTRHRSLRRPRRQRRLALRRDPFARHPHAAAG